MLKNVVFPAPFGPIRLTIAPSGIVKSTSLTATRPPNSLRKRPAVRMSATVLRPVQRLVVDALLELAFVPPLRDQPGRSEQHHEHDEDAVDEEVVLRDVDRPVERLGQLRAELRKPFLVEIREEEAPDDRAPDAPHAAEDDHAQDEDRDVEEEVARERTALERRVVRAGDPAEERADRI